MSPKEDHLPNVQSPIIETQSQERNQTNRVMREPTLIESLDSVVEHFSPQHQSSSQQDPSTSTNTSSTPAVTQETSHQTNQSILDEDKITVVMSASDPTAADLLVSSSTNNTVSNYNSFFGIDMPFDVVSAGYAALVATGGIIGYLKAGSIPSLAAGLSFGSVLGIGAYMTSVNPDNYYLTLGTSAVLGSFMGYRFVNSGKFMPAGLITLLSIGMVARYSVRAFTQIKAHQK